MKSILAALVQAILTGIRPIGIDLLVSSMLLHILKYLAEINTMIKLEVWGQKCENNSEMLTFEIPSDCLSCFNQHLKPGILFTDRKSLNHILCHRQGWSLPDSQNSRLVSVVFTTYSCLNNFYAFCRRDILIANVVFVTVNAILRTPYRRHVCSAIKNTIFYIQKYSNRSDWLIYISLPLQKSTQNTKYH